MHARVGGTVTYKQMVIQDITLKYLLFLADYFTLKSGQGECRINVGLLPEDHEKGDMEHEWLGRTDEQRRDDGR